MDHERTPRFSCIRSQKAPFFAKAAEGVQRLTIDRAVYEAMLDGDFDGEPIYTL